MHEWNPHIIPGLLQCRWCRCIRYEADLVTENRDVHSNRDWTRDDIALKAYTSSFIQTLETYKRSNRILYVYSNNSYYVFSQGKILANWTLVHPNCIEQIQRKRIPTPPLR